MVERYRDAKFVLIVEPHKVAIVEAIVEYVEVREGRTLGETCRPRGELNVGCIFIVDAALAEDELLCICCSVNRIQIFEIEHAWDLLVAYHDNVFEIRKIRYCTQVQRITCLLYLRYNIVNDFDVIRSLEPVSKHKSLDSDLLQAVLELALLECRIHIHENQISSRGSKLQNRPLDLVRTVDSDSVAFLQAEGY